MLWGASNSGGFAVTLARRHPATFRAALASSPVFDSVTAVGAGPAPDYYVTAGSFEPRVERAARSLADVLRQSGSRVEYERYVGGHDDLIWEEIFIRQLRWAIER